jgi:hypothetical protein
MTVEELEGRMSVREFAEWCEVFRMKQEAHEEAMREAKSGRGRR